MMKYANISAFTSEKAEFFYLWSDDFSSSVGYGDGIFLCTEKKSGLILLNNVQSDSFLT